MDQNFVKKAVYHSSNDSLQVYSYYDGLGNLYETIRSGASPTGNDIGELYEYDAIYRVNKKWLPLPLSGTNGTCRPKDALKESFLENENGTSFIETEYFSSRNLPYKVSGAGYRWKINNKTQNHEYMVNKYSDNILGCITYRAIGNIISKGNNYADSTVNIEKTTDEDGHVKYEFRDRQNRLILLRQMNNSVKHDTYYVYDDYDNLCVVLPPLASDAFEQLSNGNHNIENQNSINSYGYYYIFDVYNRCIKKKLPGCEPVYMVYDQSDRLRLSQDGKQRARNVWTYIKYDVFGREAIRGEFKRVGSASAIQTELDNNTNMYETFNYSLTDFYTNITYPTESCLALTAKYYDDYAFYNYASSSLPGFFYSKMSTMTSLFSDPQKTYNYLTCMKSAVIGPTGTTYRWTAFFYDGFHDTPFKTLRSNVCGNVDLEELNMDYTGQIQSKTLYHGSIYSNVTEYYTYFYDHAGRLENSYHKLKIGNNYTDSVCLESNTYDEIGQLKTRVLANGAETLNYDYNVRGWLNEASGDYFSENLYYETKRDGSNGCFNGNISQQDIQYRAGGYTNMVPLQFENTYDQLDRLTNSSISGNFTRFGENLSYDKHGNITSFQRGGITDHNWTTGSVPNLPDHQYSSVDLTNLHYNGNQVEYITDSGSDALYTGAQDFKNRSTSSDEYDYDQNGNMTKDLNKDVVTMSWNSLNLPDTIQLKGGHMESFIYDAAGQKEQVTRVTVTTSNVTIPIGRTLNNAGISVTKTSAIRRYASNVVYSDNRISEILLPDGILKRTNAITSNPPVFSYNYYIKDHLGNVRTVIDGSGTIKQVNNYYPFGVEYGESAENQTMMTYQDYQYGGKEFDRKFEINLYDFHARPYDATRAQWTSPDPLAEKYYSISPYAYCANNPLKFIDPDGRESLIFFNANKETDKTLIGGAKKFKDDNAIHIFAHGNQKGIYAYIDGKTVSIKDAKNLTVFLSDHSDVWKNRKDGEDVTVVLHSCRTGEGENSFAKNVSNDMDGVTIIAPDQRDFISSDKELGPYKSKYTDTNNEYKRDENGNVKSKERSDERGNWKVFKNGEETESYIGGWIPKQNPNWIDKLLYKNK